MDWKKGRGFINYKYFTTKQTEWLVINTMWLDFQETIFSKLVSVKMSLPSDRVPVILSH